MFNIQSKSDCVEMTNDLDEAGKWNDGPCDTYNAYLCQTMPSKYRPFQPDFLFHLHRARATVVN